MFSHQLSPTKEKIYRAAATMFCAQSYDAVSMRDLARAVGIQHSSIYNHFQGKKDILLDLYGIYSAERKKILSYTESLLAEAETIPVDELLDMIDYHFDPEITGFMNQILSIAVRCMPSDLDSKRFIADNVFVAHELLQPILQKLIKIGRIEAFDTDAFCSVINHYCFSSVALLATDMEVGTENWSKGLKYLYSTFIKPL